MSKKKLKNQDPALQPPKALMQLVDAFTDTYKPVEREEYADEVLTVRRIREYFQAWPIPKMPDPLPPYLVELERRGFAMQTSYDGHPALFCVRWHVDEEICSAEETHDKEAEVRTGLVSMKALIARRMMDRPADDGDDEEDEEPELKTDIQDCRRCWCDTCGRLEECEKHRDGAQPAGVRPLPCIGCVNGLRFKPKEEEPCEEYTEAAGFNNG